MKEKQIIKKKLLIYCLSLFCAITFLFLIIFIFNTIDKEEVLYFNALKFSFFASIVGFLIWKKFSKSIFEDIIVYLSVLFACLFAAYIGPMTLDRSLSSFMIFYSVENQDIPKNIKDEKYFNNFIKRRYDDAVKIGYFSCNHEKCYPTCKAKLTYYIFYPIGKLTKSLRNYENFKLTVEKLNKN